MCGSGYALPFRLSSNDWGYAPKGIALKEYRTGRRGKATAAHQAA